VDANVYVVEPAILSEITVPCPNSVAVSGKRVAGHGWVIGNAAIIEASILIGDELVCSAVTDLPRPDVAAAYPDNPRARHAGFEFSGIVPMLTVGPTELVLRLGFADGDIAERRVPIVIKAGEVPVPPSLADPLAELQALSLDEAKVDRKGILTVRGWAASFSPIEMISVFAGDALLGVAEHGIARPDVAVAHPYYPNAGTAGFQFRAERGADALAAGSIRVVALALGDVAKQATLPIDLPVEPAILSEISMPCPNSVAVSGKRVAGHGWVIGNAAVVEASVLIGDELMCSAVTDLPRPDVAAAYPDNPRARHAGFEFSGIVPALTAGPTELVLRLSFADGDIAELRMPILIEVGEVLVPPSLGDPLAELQALSLDEAKVDRKGILTVSGWAAAFSPIEMISVFVGDALLGVAEHGLARPDVAIAHPYYPNAATAGFRFRTDLGSDALAAGSVRVVARALGDVTKRATLPIEAPPAILSEISMPCPNSVAVSGKRVAGHGWVIGNAAIVEASVLIGGELVCSAVTDLPRPDVAAAHPDNARARHAGFEFSGIVPALTAGPTDLLLHLSFADGEVAERRVPILIEAGEIPVPPRLANPLAELETLSLDEAKVDRKGILTVSGWAAAFSPIEMISVFVGDALVGVAEHGLARPDVAVAHPDYPNAATAGFRFRTQLGADALAAGSVRVVARALGNIVRQATLPIEVPPMETAIHFYCDLVALREDGRLEVEGWAISAPGIAEIEVAFDGVSIGEATIGLPRPDVRNAHPHTASAHEAGFCFEHRLRERIVGEHVIELAIRTLDGGELRVPLPALAEPAPPEKVEDATSTKTNEAIRFFIDTPAINNGVAAEKARGTLLISGWALARKGLADIEVFLGDRSVGLAYAGQGRPDIAAAYPDWEGALRSGFAMMVPHRAFSAARHTVRVVIRDQGGDSVTESFEIEVEAEAERGASAQLRERIPQAEIDLKSALIAQSGLRPAFAVGLRLADLSASELRRARRTLAGLGSQAWGDRSVSVLLPPGITRSEAASAKAALQPGLGDIELGLCDAVGKPLADLLAGAGAAGDRAFLMLLRAGDRLGPDALLECALQAAILPEADLLYADERRIDPASDARAPFLKPDWSPDLLLSTNYIGRPYVVAASLLEAIGTSARQLADAGEYDLVLRATEAARAICHIPLVLAERGECAIDTCDQERAALHAALARRGIRASVLTGRAPATFRVKRRVATRGLVSIIIPTAGARGLVAHCISSIRATTRYSHVEILCIDNIPVENVEDKAWLRANADRVIEIPEPFNWSRFNNQAAAAANGEFLLFLNDDIEVLEPDWLHALLEHAEREEVGVVGPLLLYPDGKVQHAGMFLSGSIGRHAFRFAAEDEPGPFGLALSQRNVIAVTGACLLVRREVFHALGCFDEAHAVINNDLDFCLRVWRAGKRVVFTPFARLTHHELASRDKLDEVFDAPGFNAEWRTRTLLGDPFFHPALSPDHDVYTAEAEPVRIIVAGHPILARERVRRILATKVDHIGDFVTALPALRRLKQLFPDAELHVLAANASVPLATLEPTIDSVIGFDFFNVVSRKGQCDLTEADFAALAAKLALYRFDIAIDLRKQGETRELLRRTGARLLAGYDHHGRFPWLDIALEWEDDLRFGVKRSHVSDDLTRLVEAISAACETDRGGAVDAVTRHAAIAAACALPAVAEDGATLFARRVVCVHPGSGSLMRQWPAEHFAGLIDLLVGEAGVHVVVIGAPTEAEVAFTMLTGVQPQYKKRVWSFVGRIGMQDLPVVLQACDLYVGNNSGPKHIAARLGVPTVGVHSAVVDAHEWGPLGPRAVAVQREMSCGPCYLESPEACSRGMACLNGLRPGEVFRVCRQMLM
jgi:ADP-heptose:LPS heptosyltransferase/GT2 family glycosyltransferase